MRFLVDAQLPPMLARWLAGAGHDATHVGEHGLIEASDEAIWAFALATNAVILTKDADFAARRMRTAGGPQIVWLRLTNMRRGQLVLRVAVMFPSVVEALENGEEIIEVV